MKDDDELHRHPRRYLPTPCAASAHVIPTFHGSPRVWNRRPQAQYTLPTTTGKISIHTISSFASQTRSPCLQQDSRCFLCEYDSDRQKEKPTWKGSQSFQSEASPSGSMQLGGTEAFQQMDSSSKDPSDAPPRMLPTPAEPKPTPIKLGQTPDRTVCRAKHRRSEGGEGTGGRWGG